MAHYAHIRRYGTRGGGSHVDVLSDDEVVYRGRRWSLRDGARGDWFKGFYPAQDGRFVRFGARGPNDVKTPLEIVHADGNVVSAGGVGVFDRADFVGRCVVIEADRNPPTVIDDRGSVLGRLPQSATHAARFNPHDGRTLWYCEHNALVQYDVATQHVVRRIEPSAGHVFIGLAVLSSEHVATFERTDKNHAAFHSDDDRLVLFDAAGARVAERAALAMSIAPVREGLVASHHRDKTFVVYDTKLEPVEVVPMFEPDRDGHNALLELPAGRGFIAIGGRGFWDHYGEGGATTTKKAAPKKKKVAPKKNKAAPKKKAATKKKKQKR